MSIDNINIQNAAVTFGKEANASVTIKIPYKGFNIVVSIDNLDPKKKNDIRVTDLSGEDVTDVIFPDEKDWLVAATAENIKTAIRWIDYFVKNNPFDSI